MRNGLSKYVGKVLKMMSRPDCEDGFLTEACTKSLSLEDLSSEIMEEMESDRHPTYPNYYREYGKAIAIVRINYQIPVDGIAGLNAEDVQDIESGELHPTSAPLTRYAEAIGLSLNDFLNEVANNVDISKSMEAIA